MALRFGTTVQQKNGVMTHKSGFGRHQRITHCSARIYDGFVSPWFEVPCNAICKIENDIDIFSYVAFRSGAQRSDIPREDPPLPFELVKKSEGEGMESIWQRMLKLTAEYHLKKMKEDAIMDVQRAHGLVSHPTVSSSYDGNVQGSPVVNNYQTSNANVNTQVAQNTNTNAMNSLSRNGISSNVPTYSNSLTNSHYIPSSVPVTQDGRRWQYPHKQQDTQNTQSAESMQNSLNAQITQIPVISQTTTSSNAETKSYAFSSTLNNGTTNNQVPKGKEDSISEYDQMLKNYWENYYRYYQTSLTSSLASIPRNPPDLMDPETGKPTKSMFAEDSEHIQTVLDEDMTGKLVDRHSVAKDTNFKYPSPPAGFLKFNSIRENITGGLSGVNGSFTDKVLNTDLNPQQDLSGLSKDLLNEDKLLGQEEIYFRPNITYSPTRQHSTQNPYQAHPYYQSQPQSYQPNTPTNHPDTNLFQTTKDQNDKSSSKTEMTVSTAPALPETRPQAYTSDNPTEKALSSLQEEPPIVSSSLQGTNSSSGGSRDLLAQANSSIEQAASQANSSTDPSTLSLPSTNPIEAAVSPVTVAQTPASSDDSNTTAEVATSPTASHAVSAAPGVSQTSNILDATSLHDTVASNQGMQSNNQFDDDDDNTYLNNLDISALIKELIKLQTLQKKKQIEKSRKEATHSQKKSFSSSGRLLSELLKHKKLNRKGLKKTLLDRVPDRLKKKLHIKFVHPLPRFS